MSTLIVAGQAATGRFNLAQVPDLGGSTLRFILEDVPLYVFGNFGYCEICVLGSGPSEFDLVSSTKLVVRSQRLDFRQTSLPVQTYVFASWFKAVGRYQVFIN